MVRTPARYRMAGSPTPMLTSQPCFHSGLRHSIPILRLISHKMVRPARLRKNNPSIITARSAPPARTGSPATNASWFAPTAATTLAAQTTTESDRTCKSGAPILAASLAHAAITRFKIKTRASRYEAVRCSPSNGHSISRSADLRASAPCGPGRSAPSFPLRQAEPNGAHLRLPSAN